MKWNEMKWNEMKWNEKTIAEEEEEKYMYALQIPRLQPLAT